MRQHRGCRSVAAVVLGPLRGVSCSSGEPSGQHLIDVSGRRDTSLPGEWQRAESTFTRLDGMVVEVQSDESDGLMVAEPEGEFQSQERDVRWRSIEPTGEGEWSFEDLVREAGSGETSYVPGVITFALDGN